MFISGMSPYSAFAFSILTMTIGVPSAIKHLQLAGNALGRQNSIQLRHAFCHRVCVVVRERRSLRSIFGATLAGPVSTRRVLRCRALSPDHGGCSHFGMFAGVYFWFPKMFGRFLNEGIGKVHFWITFIGVYAIFMPMHYLGLAGHPRRYFDTTAVAYPREASAGSMFSSVLPRSSQSERSSSSC